MLLYCYLFVLVLHSVYMTFSVLQSLITSAFFTYFNILSNYKKRERYFTAGLPQYYYFRTNSY